VARVIPQRELRNQNAAIIAAVAEGETFVVTRNGTPVAELRPVAPQRRTFVDKAALAQAVAHRPHIDLGAFRADIDRLVDQRL
jgi:prevent-host-death family protein